MFDFQKLEVYHKAMELNKDIALLTRNSSFDITTNKERERALSLCFLKTHSQTHSPKTLPCRMNFIKIISPNSIAFFYSLFEQYICQCCLYKHPIGHKTLRMDTFGKRLRECRKIKGLSQNELAGLLHTNHSVIGKYERDDVKPSIDVVKRLAEVLNTTIAYLLGEAETDELFRDPDMLRRLKEINALPEEDKRHILFNLDAVLRDVKTRQAYAS